MRTRRRMERTGRRGQREMESEETRKCDVI